MTIMQELHLAPRTFYRYLSAVFEDDRRLLVENISDEEFLNQTAICRDRLLKQRRDIVEQIINNPDADDKSRIAAHHLIAEIAAAVLRLYTEGPGVLASRQNLGKDREGNTCLPRVSYFRQMTLICVSNKQKITDNPYLLFQKSRSSFAQ
jgi:hypothetical protein